MNLLPRKSITESQKTLCAWSLLLALAAGWPSLGNTILDPCQAAWDAIQIAGRPSSRRVKRAIIRKTPTTFFELMDAFSNNFIPDFSDPDQARAFEVYRKFKLGDPFTYVPKSGIDQLAKAQRENPAHGKLRFSSSLVSVDRFTAPPLSEISEFQGRVKGFSDILLKPNHEGKEYWSRVLKEVPFCEFFSSELEKELQNKTLPGGKKTKLVLEAAARKIEVLGKEHPSREALKRLVVDAANLTGFLDAKIAEGLGHSDGLEQMRALTIAIEKRDLAIQGVASGLHYDELLAKFEMKGPSFLPEENQFKNWVADLRKVLDQTKSKSPHSATHLVRPLSWAEAPWRSCLGGSDCSSWSYFTKALEEPYHYFTITDPVTGHSSGHVTVVLGTSQWKGKRLPIAFIDKVQNIEDSQLPWLLESVREILAKENYTLAIPKDPGGDFSGISNQANTIKALYKLPSVLNQTQLLTGFKPEVPKIEYPNEYSRAGDQLAVIPLLAYSDKGIATTLKETTPAWKIKKNTLNLASLLEEVHKLKESDKIEDKLRYFSAEQAFSQEGNRNLADPAFEKTWQGWLEDKSQPVRLKNRILTILLENQGIEEAAKWIHVLSPEQKGNLAQNWWQTPRLKRRILEDSGDEPISRSFLDLARHHEATLRSALEASHDSDLADIDLKNFFKTDFEPRLSSIPMLRVGAAIGDWELLETIRDHYLPRLYEGVAQESNANRARGAVKSVLQVMEKRILPHALPRKTAPPQRRIKLGEKSYLIFEEQDGQVRLETEQGKKLPGFGKGVRFFYPIPDRLLTSTDGKKWMQFDPESRETRPAFQIAGVPDTDDRIRRSDFMKVGPTGLLLTSFNEKPRMFDLKNVGKEIKIPSLRKTFLADEFVLLNDGGVLAVDGLDDIRYWKEGLEKWRQLVKPKKREENLDEIDSSPTNTLAVGESSALFYGHDGVHLVSAQGANAEIVAKVLGEDEQGAQIRIRKVVLTGPNEFVVLTQDRNILWFNDSRQVARLTTLNPSDISGGIDGGINAALARGGKKGFYYQIHLEKFPAKSGNPN